MTNNLFEELKNLNEYKKHIELLPEEERKEIEQKLKDLCNNFEKEILLPLQSIFSK
ncbi:MAG: hypothetical protein QXO21_01875 [Candidatus Anstonellales archaeon]